MQSEDKVFILSISVNTVQLVLTLLMLMFIWDSFCDKMLPVVDQKALNKMLTVFMVFDMFEFSC